MTAMTAIPATLGRDGRNLGFASDMTDGGGQNPQEKRKDCLELDRELRLSVGNPELAGSEVLGMGMIFKKPWTTPLPPSAEITEHDGRRSACWRLRNGQLKTVEVFEGKKGTLRYRGETREYMVRYRNEAGKQIEVPTGCKDKVAARAVLAKLERHAELIKAGIITDAEADTANYSHRPMSDHLDAFVRHLKTKSGNPRRIKMVRRRLERLFEDCRFPTLNKMSAENLEKWLVQQADSGMAAATRNTYREAAVGFGNWCCRANRLTHNPFAHVPRADQNADRRHERRALTEQELMRLLNVARFRPLAERGREIVRTEPDPKLPPKSRATWKRKALTVNSIDAAVKRARDALKDNPDLIAQLERTGCERALAYKTLLLTGLRKGELASLTVGQLDFSGQVAYAILNAADEKNRQGSNIPLRADLATELSLWLQERLDAMQREASENGKPIPVRLPPSTPLFQVPSGLSRILDRDLATAGIPKRDERNRVFDVHAIRMTFGTHLFAAGVPLRTVQAAMRHSKPELTANIYTDPKLLDVAGAIDALPALAPTPKSAATGT